MRKASVIAWGIEAKDRDGPHIEQAGAHLGI